MNKLYLKFKKIISLSRSKSLIFLHVGKTAGTSLRTFVWKSNIPFTYNVKFPNHGQIPSYINSKPIYLISLRDPLERLQSGFDSRLRQGRPAYNNPWSNDEKIFFSKFYSFKIFVKECLNKPKLYDNFKDLNIHARYDYTYYLELIKTKGILSDIITFTYSTNQLDLCEYLGIKTKMLPVHLHKSPKSDFDNKIKLYSDFTDMFLKSEYNSIEILKNGK